MPLVEGTPSRNRSCSPHNEESLRLAEAFFIQTVGGYCCAVAPRVALMPFIISFVAGVVVSAKKLRS